MVTETLFGLNGETVTRFIDGTLSEPMAYRQFARPILPGAGPSQTKLQSFSMRTPMGPTTSETDTDVADPQLGYQIILDSIERGTTLPLTRTKIENAGADRDALVGGLLFELGTLGPITLDYLFDLWLSEYCFNGTATGLGVSGGDGVPFFSNSHLRYAGDSTGNDNLEAAKNFGATEFGDVLIRLNSQLDLKGNAIRASKDLAIVYGPALMHRVAELLNSEGKPGEMSNTWNVANGYNIMPYMCPRYVSENSMEYYWAVFDRRAMMAPNGSGLNMKLMRLPGIFPSRSNNGLIFYYTNSMRAGIGSGTKTFGVGCSGTA